MDALNAYGPKYGANVHFDYGGIDGIEIFDDPDWDSRDYHIADWLFWSMNESTFPDPEWDPDSINIYFVGQLKDQNDNDKFALTCDPALPETVVPPDPFLLPHIAITDGGNPLIPGFPAYYLYIDWRVLEHEMCHFLLRQASYPGHPGRYDSGEHDPDPEATHLMRRAPPFGEINNADAGDCGLRIFYNQYLIP